MKTFVVRYLSQYINIIYIYKYILLNISIFNIFIQSICCYVFVSVLFIFEKEHLEVLQLLLYSVLPQAVLLT